MKDETLRTAFQSWETLSSTQEEILAYEASLKHVLDEEAAIREAELREMKARQEGLQEGQQKEKELTAKRMLQEGFDVETIIRLTGLSNEQVHKIEREIN